jgi:hypothetical protein
MMALVSLGRSLTGNPKFGCGMGESDQGLAMGLRAASARFSFGLDAAIPYHRAACG